MKLYYKFELYYKDVRYKKKCNFSFRFVKD